ncbi:uncharacterized mitochondrial protein AtMg00810-like [Arachis hypogaea]|uniref:uncharacterized mitochondrial protein AtMg00810-like n=1 Tax=Arachis hypogaea TaxID=3818 RepID=UPI000DEC22F5|nr:uncharacterized protein LOC112803606 [Arachis hypogaea]
MDEEYSSLMRTHTWDLVPLPPNRTPIQCRVCDGAITYLLIYVDDIIVTDISDAQIKQVIIDLNFHFALKDIGCLHYFLGLEVVPTNDCGLLLSQTKYVHDILKKANMLGSLYRSIIGSLQYLTITRPDLAYCINCVCQFMQNPLELHWKVVKRILHYISGTDQI